MGQYYDEESELHYNRFRYYSPETGQYLSHDPIGLRGGFNPYGYVFNPSVLVDPLGLKGCTVTKAGDNDDFDYTLELDKKQYPEAFGHIEDYINGNTSSGTSGDKFTVDRDPSNIAERRKESLADTPTKPGFDRDEFPMAMFSEGGEGASVRYIDPSDNRGAGSSISNALRNVPDGSIIKITFK